MSRGITLVELVVTIALSAILAVPLGRLLSQYFNGALEARDATTAMGLARGEMERLDGLNNFFDAGLNVGTRPATVTGFSGYALTIVVTCAFGDCTVSAAQGVKRVEVTVTRPAVPAAPLARLVTYRTKNVFFGV